MLKKFQEMFTEAPQPAATEKIPVDFRALLKAAEHTQPPERSKFNVDRFPIDGLASSAIKANAVLVDAEAELMKAEIEFERLMKEGREIIQELHDKVEKATQVLEEKQLALLREQMRIGALDRVPDLQKLLQAAKDRNDGITHCQDYSPTVRLEQDG